MLRILSKYRDADPLIHIEISYPQSGYRQVWLTCASASQPIESNECTARTRSMAALDDYEADYAAHMSAAREKVELAAGTSSSDQRRTAVAAGERAADAAKDVVQLMELEGRSLPAANRPRLQGKLRDFRIEIADLKARLKELRSAPKPSPASNDCIREELFAGASNGYPSSDEGERSRMLANSEQISKGTKRLKDAHAVTLDMENTANSILGDLAKQRETLLRSRNTLSYASEGLESSGRILRTMARRAAANKMMLWVVIGLIVLLLVVLGWSPGGGAAPASAPVGEWTATTPRSG